LRQLAPEPRLGFLSDESECELVLSRARDAGASAEEEVVDAEVVDDQS